MFDKSESITKLLAALVKAQGEVEPARKDSKNPHLKNTYTSLTAVLAVSKDVCSKHGLAITQWPMEAGSIYTIVAHESGEWMGIKSTTPLPKNDPQGVGSAISYLRRYSIKSILGIADADDDAEAASGDVKQEAKPKQEPPKQKPLSEVISDGIKYVYSVLPNSSRDYRSEIGKATNEADVRRICLEAKQEALLLNNAPA